MYFRSMKGSLIASGTGGLWAAPKTPPPIGLELHIRVGHGSAEDQAANAAKAIDSKTSETSLFLSATSDGKYHGLGRSPTGISEKDL